MSYFYFWNIFPALAQPVDAWADRCANCLLCFSGLGRYRFAGCGLSVLRFQSPEGSRHIRPRSAAAVGLFFITGLDVIFASLFIRFIPGDPFITEWWNGNNQVTAWTGAALWVPHHIGGLVAGITGILIFPKPSTGNDAIQKSTSGDPHCAEPVVNGWAFGLCGFYFCHFLGSSIWLFPSWSNLAFSVPLDSVNGWVSDLTIRTLYL